MKKNLFKLLSLLLALCLVLCACGTAERDRDDDEDEEESETKSISVFDTTAGIAEDPDATTEAPITETESIELSGDEEKILGDWKLEMSIPRFRPGDFLREHEIEKGHAEEVEQDGG